MKKSKKIKLNLIIGIVGEILTILLGIIVPRFILTSYGSEINGLIHSVAQIYSYIGLLEAGVGVATLQALYKTVGQNNLEATNAILSATNKFYRKTGIWYLFAILIFSSIYPLFINSDIPIITIILIIFVNGIGNVIQYFFQAKYFLLLEAEGKEYIKASLMIFTNLFKNISRIVLMSYAFDVVFVQSIAMCVSLIQMIFITLYINKKYKWIDLSVPPNIDALSQSGNVLIHQISGLVFNNTDCIVLTIFCGLKTVSVYSMYALLIGMVQTAFLTVARSFVFSLGQAFHGDRNKFIKLYDCYELYYLAFTFALFSIANVFILPFMRLYTQGIKDVDYIDNALPLLFISSSLLSCSRAAPSNLVSWAGHFKKTQGRAILEAIINIVVSLIAVKVWGIYGVLIGTISALFYRTNDFIIYANMKILNRKPWISYYKIVVNIIIFILILYLSTLINMDLSSYVKIFLYCIPISIGVFILYFSITSFAFPHTAQNAYRLFRRFV